MGGHILSQPPGTYPDRPEGTYTGPFYDYFVLFSYLAAATQRIHFSGIIILPLYPTALVAKQAAELQWFSGGRLELGIGVSWSEREFQALGQEIHTRGVRVSEQVRLLRRLWAESFVTFEGKYHQLDSIGLRRLPAQPIPIWFATGQDQKRVLRRVARLADGWWPMGDSSATIDSVREMMREAGRDPSTLMLRSMIIATDDGPDAWVANAKRLRSIGVTHLQVGAPPGLTPGKALPRLIEARRVLAAALD